MRNLVAVVAVMMMVAVSAQADVVALKRDTGLDTGGSIDAQFTDAVVHTVTVEDSSIDTAGNSRWYNNGGRELTGNSTINLFKFDLTSVPGLMGGTIHLAEFRIAYNSGNNFGAGNVYRVVTYDWIEGTASYSCPGVDGGVSYAHPIGHQAAAYRDADNGTTGPLQSWGITGERFFDKTVDCDMAQGKKASGNGFAVWPITPIVAEWAADASPNYGINMDNSNYTLNMSEAGSALQPVLFINYTPAVAPDAIDDLAIVDVDWSAIELAWTAPADDNGEVDAYDVRYSTAPITEANWASATQCVGEPATAAAGTEQIFVVTDLTPETQYYFAIKAADAGGLISDLSDVVNDTTLVLDGVAPEAITDLAVVTVRPNLVTIEFTATGDDGAAGAASTYDVRYSTTAITNDADFAAATAATGKPKPAASGVLESFDVTGLTELTNYYFAVKASDEVPNGSAMSNVVGPVQTDQDLLAADAITDLESVGAQSTVVHLRWTAPADNGSAGMGAYDVRYSTTAIVTNADFAAATPFTAGVPEPYAAGEVVLAAVSGLASEQHYYFAVKSADLAIPVNLSGLSNVVEGDTAPAVQPVVLLNPWISNDRVADCRTREKIGETYQNSYTPDGVVLPSDNEDRSINAYNNFKRRYYHWAAEPPNHSNLIGNLNVFGWALCGRHANGSCEVIDAIEDYGNYGLAHRMIGLPGHWIYEVGYDGKWHAMDTMTTMYIYDKSVPPTIASCAQIKADHALILDAKADGRGCPGFLLCGDKATWFADVMDSYSPGPDGSGSQSTNYSMNMELRLGETFERTCLALPGQRSSFGTPPYHHEVQHDWKDTVNFPYWEPYGNNIIEGITAYRAWSNGVIEVAPDFTNGGWDAAVESTVNIATTSDDGMTPAVHVASVDTVSEMVFKINSPYYMTSGTIDGAFVRNDSGDTNMVEVSVNGIVWTPLWENVTDGVTQVTDLDLGSGILSLSEYWVKITLQADGDVTDAGVDDLKISIVFEHNKGAMAYLDKGVNNITVTLDNPADLVGKGAECFVRYEWKEYDGLDWTISRSRSVKLTTSPQTFQITVLGDKVPRTESIKMVLAPAGPPDLMAPSLIKGSHLFTE